MVPNSSNRNTINGTNRLRNVHLAFGKDVLYLYTLVNQLYEAVCADEDATKQHTKAAITVMNAICLHPSQPSLPKKRSIANSVSLKPKEEANKIFRTSHEEGKSSKRTLSILEAKVCAVYFHEDDKNINGEDVDWVQCDKYTA